MPATPLSMKLEMVAPVKILLSNSLKSMNGLPALPSAMKNSTPATTVTAAAVRMKGLVQPSLLPCVITICRPTMPTMKVTMPARSSVALPSLSTLLSGVPRIISMPSTDTAAQAKKIERQPKFCVIRPPNSAHRPEPPHEPIDHIDTARWRSAPSQ